MSAANLIPEWINNFRRLNLEKKAEVYNNFSMDLRLILQQTLAKATVLTSARVFEGLPYSYPDGNRRCYTFNETEIKTLKQLSPLKIVQILQTYDSPAILNLDKIGLTIQDVIKHFEYGVYIGFLYRGNAEEPLSVINAWLFGFSWQRLINNISQYNITLDEWRIFIRYYPFMPDKAEECLAYHDIQLKLHKGTMNPTLIVPVEDNFNITYNHMMQILLEEINSRGIVFDVDLPVYHMNHIRFVPKEYEFMFIGRGGRREYRSKLTNYLSELTHQIFLYPRFNKSLWKTYPKTLKSIIFTVIGMMRHRKAEFPLGKDITMEIFLHYVVFNFYSNAEDRLHEWTTLGDKYAKLNWTTLNSMAMDYGLTSQHSPGYGSVEEEHHKDLAYKIAAYHLGYVGKNRTLEIAYIEYVTDHAIRWKIIRSVWPNLKGGLATRNLADYESDLDALHELLNVCYTENIAVSLIQKGAIKFTRDGEIVDLPKAKSLSDTMHQEHLTIMGKLNRSDGKKLLKRRRKTESDDEDWQE